MTEIRAWGMSGVPEILYGDPSEEEIAAAHERGGRNGVLIVPEGLGTNLHEAIRRNARSSQPDEIPEWREREKLFEAREAEIDILFNEGRISEEKHWALRVQLREEFGYDRLPDPRAVTVDEGEVSMAEEPIEHRLRRSWLNGFKEGVERSAWAAVEVTGRWDY